MVDRSRFAAPGSFDAPVIKTREVAGLPAVVFAAWTDSETLTKWIGSAASVDPEVGGRFEVLFDPDQPVGSQGSEGCQVLALLPPKLLAFTWNSPPSLNAIRDQFTFVTVEIEGAGAGSKVTLTHAGHGSGEAWDAGLRSWSGAFARRDFLDCALEWAEQEPWAIGGCCRVGPAMIRELAELWPRS